MNQVGAVFKRFALVQTQGPLTKWPQFKKLFFSLTLYYNNITLWTELQSFLYMPVTHSCFILLQVLHSLLKIGAEGSRSVIHCLLVLIKDLSSLIEHWTHRGHFPAMHTDATLARIQKLELHGT